MDTTPKEVTVEKKRQVKFTFTGLVATVVVNGVDDEDKAVFDITPLSDEIKLELMQYGFKQKLSDFRAGDKLTGYDKIAAMVECYEMLVGGTFRQKRQSGGVWLTDEVVENWRNMIDSDKETVRKVAPDRAKKLDEKIE